MKIKKSDLTRLIECYINEQMSAPVNTGDGASGSKYPESITADNQKLCEPAGSKGNIKCCR